MKMMIILILTAPGISYSAATVYKTADAHGQIIYTDKPPQPGSNGQLMDLLPPPSKSEIKAATERAMRLLKAEQAIGQRLRARAALRQELRDAQATLRETKHNLLIGRSPQENELQGTKRGSIRLREKYFFRQTALISAVNEAKSKVREVKRRVKHRQKGRDADLWRIEIVRDSSDVIGTHRGVATVH